MNTDVLDPRTDAELRSLDAASDIIVDSGRRDATLNSILGQAPHSPEAASDIRPVLRWRPSRRWVALAAAGAVAAAVAGAVVLPRLEATQTRPAASPSVTPADAALVRDACIENWRPMDKYAQNLTVLLTERRGDIVAMALIRRTVDHRLIDVSCVARLAPGSRDVHDADAAGGTGLGYPGPQARSFTQRDVGFHFGGADDGGSLISGEVGSDVVGVTANVDGRPIAATIRDGAYAAWWPSTVRWDTDQAPPGQKFDADPEITFDLTFKDGTVERNARGYTPEVPADGLGGSQTMGQETSP